MDEFIEPLKENAIFIRIDTINSGGGINVRSLLDSLKEINNSFEQYSEILFLRSLEKEGVSIDFKSAIKNLKKDNSLMIVDLDFASFGAALSPNYMTSNMEIQDFKLTTWKKDNFNEFKEDFFNDSFSNQDHISSLEDKFSDKERSKIFKPLMKIVNNDKVRLNYGMSMVDCEKSFRGLTKESKSVLVPNLRVVHKESEKENNHVIQIFANVTGDPDLFGKKKIIVNEVYSTKVLEHETYPIITDLINYDNDSFQLHEPIEVIVSYEDDVYLAECNELDIVVYSEYRDTLDEEFFESFTDTYNIIALQEDSELSEGAIKVKGKMLGLVKHHEKNNGL